MRPYPYLIWAIASALTALSCGKVSLESTQSSGVRRESSDARRPVADQPPAPASAPAPVPPPVTPALIPPVMVTGVYLTSACRWELIGIAMSCEVKRQDPSTAALRAEQVALRVSDAKGAVQDAASYQQTVAELSGELAFRLIFVSGVKATEVSVQVLDTRSGEVANTIPAGDIKAIVTEVTAYRDAKFQGPSKIFNVGSYERLRDFSELTTFASLRIPNNLAVELCEVLSPQSRNCRLYHGDVPDILSLPKVDVLDVSIAAPAVVAYRNASQQGPALAYPIGAYDASVLDRSLLASQISSLHVPPSLYVRICSSPDGRSDCTEYRAPGPFEIPTHSDNVHFLQVYPVPVK